MLLERRNERQSWATFFHNTTGRRGNKPCTASSTVLRGVGDKKAADGNGCTCTTFMRQALKMSFITYWSTVLHTVALKIDRHGMTGAASTSNDFAADVVTPWS